jgi:hypothetical protein
MGGGRQPTTKNKQIKNLFLLGGGRSPTTKPTTAPQKTK